MKSNIVIVRMFFFGVIVFVICLFFYYVMWLWYEMGEGKWWMYFNDVLVFVNVLVYFNSFVDFFIFGRVEVFEWCKSCFVMLVKCLNLFGWRISFE